MKIIDGHALVDKIKKKADATKDSGWYTILGLVLGIVNDMPEAEAYTEARQRIENMEKIIEDQQERIDIMAADMPVWIDITKEPPTKDDRDILVISEGEVCFCTHYFSDNGRHEYETPDIFESFPIENITHWMRCPKPLKGADDNVNS